MNIRKSLKALRKPWKGVPIVVLICILISTILAAYALITLTVNFTWTWTPTQSFQVFTDAGHTEELTTDPSTLDLGSFNQGSNSGSKTFYFHNNGDVSVTIYPHTSGTNFDYAWTPTSLTLSPAQDGIMTMAYTISGDGSASVTFDLIP